MGETSEGSPKNITPCLHRSNSVAQFTLESTLWLKMEAPLLILTLVVISIPIVALTWVIVFLPLARKRNPLVFGFRGRRSEVLELDMKAMIDARLRQTRIDPFIEMVDITPQCSNTESETSKAAFKLLPPRSDQM